MNRLLTILCVSLLLLLEACAPFWGISPRSQPAKPAKVPPPPVPTVKAPKALRETQPLVVTPKTWSRPAVAGRLTITNLTVFNGMVTLGWTGTGTNQVLWSQDTAHWLPLGFPTTLHSVIVALPAQNALFRVSSSTAPTNRLDFGNLFVDSQFVDSDTNGNSAFIAHDILQAIPYLVIYDRQGVVHRYVIPGVVPNDLYSGGEVGLLGDRILVTTVNTLTAQAKLLEYTLTNGTLTMVNEILTGDTDSRAPDILKMRDGRVVVCFAEQGSGLYGWFLHRDLSGIWFDDGPMDLGSTNAGEVTAVIRLFEFPVGSVYTVALKDSGGFLRISSLDFHGKGINISTNFTLVDNSVCGVTNCYGLAAIHGEIPFSMVAKVDWSGNRVLFCYTDEARCYTTNADPDLQLSMARVAVTAWNADNSWNLALVTPDPTVKGAVNQFGGALAINPGATERVYGYYHVNLNPLTMYYVPLTQSADQTWPFYCPLTVWDGTHSRFIIQLQGYQNALHHRTYSDIVGIDPAGKVFALINP